MAQRTVVEMTDDLDGSPADETVSFGLDGTAYEIDLSEDNAGLLRDRLATYVGAARRAGGARRGRAPRGRAAAAPKAVEEIDPKVVRAWAQSEGIEVSSRGRVSKDLIDR